MVKTRNEKSGRIFGDVKRGIVSVNINRLTTLEVGILLSDKVIDEGLFRNKISRLEINPQLRAAPCADGGKQNPDDDDKSAARVAQQSRGIFLVKELLGAA